VDLSLHSSLGSRSAWVKEPPLGCPMISTVNALETGKFDPSLKLAFQIARLFRLGIEEIFQDEKP